MPTPRAPTARKLADIIPRLMGFARLIQNLANRFKGLARTLAVTGLLSALLLDRFLARAWGFSAMTVVILGLILILPGLVLHQPDGAYTPEADQVLRDGAPIG